MSTWTMDRRGNWPMRRRIYKDGRTYERREQYKEQLQEKVHVCRLQHHFKVNYTFDQFSNVFDRLIKRNWQYGFKNIWYLQYSFGPFTNVHFVFQLPTAWTWRLHQLFFEQNKRFNSRYMKYYNSNFIIIYKQKMYQIDKIW